MIEHKLIKSLNSYDSIEQSRKISSIKRVILSRYNKEYRYFVKGNEVIDMYDIYFFDIVHYLDESLLFTNREEAELELIKRKI